MKPTFRLPDTSSRVGTDVFSLRKCRPKSGSHFFSQEMPSRIGKPFFLPGNAVPNRETVFFVWKCRPESGDHFFLREGSSRIGTLFFSLAACRITAPLLSAAGRLGWTIRLVISSMPYQVASYHSSSLVISSATLPTLVTLPLRTSSAARNKVPFRFAPGKKLLFLMFNSICVIVSDFISFHLQR